MGKHLLRAASAVSLIAVALAFAPAARAEEKPEKKNRQQATGVIESMDAKAKTVTIKKHDGSTVTFTCDKSKIATASKETAMMDDLKVGDKVLVVYAEDGGKKVAHRIGPAKAPEKKEDKPAK